MRRWTAVVAGFVAVAGSAPAVAGAQLVTSRGCPVETAQLSVRFSGTDTDITAARSKMDAKIAEVKGLAEERKFTRLVIQSQHFNVSSGYVGGAGGAPQFRYNGNVMFSLWPSDKAMDFMEFLTKKGYQTSINVSSYDPGTCAQDPGAIAPRSDP